MHGFSITVVQFDHEQVVWSPTGPVQATDSNVHQALQWVEGIQARGLTDILTPLSNAIHSLENHPVRRGILSHACFYKASVRYARGLIGWKYLVFVCCQVNMAGGMGIPLIFMLTDGAVKDEHEICQFVESNRRRYVGEYSVMHGFRN